LLSVRGTTQDQLATSPLMIDGCSITLVQSARDLRIYVDCDLSWRCEHTYNDRVTMLCRATSSDSSLCAVGHTSDARGCTAALPAGLWERHAGGLPAYLTRRLQSVLNAAVRLIYRLTTRDHISDALISLHWLRVPERIQYKLAVPAMQHVTAVR